MNLYICLLFLLFVSGRAYGFNKPPSFIKICSRSDNFNECALKNGREAIKFISEGDSTYHIPNMKPLKLDYVSLDASDNIKLYGTNMSVYGFDRTQLDEFDWNFEKKIVKVKLSFPLISMIATYNMNGRVLIMTIKGSGPMNNTFYENTSNVTVYYDLQRNNEKNYEFVHLEKVDVKVHVGNAYLSFDNLLNNAQLSTQMNKFINENWRYLVDDLNVSSEKIMSTIVLSIINPIAAKIPYENVVKP